MSYRTIPKKILNNVAPGKSGLFFYSEGVSFFAYMTHDGAPMLRISRYNHVLCQFVGDAPMRLFSLFDLARCMRGFAPIAHWKPVTELFK